jgi:hypothetical protein
MKTVVADALDLETDDMTRGVVLVGTLFCRAGLAETRGLARYSRWRAVEVNGRNYVDSAGETARYSASWSASDGSSLPLMKVLKMLLAGPPSEQVNLGFSSQTARSSSS